MNGKLLLDAGLKGYRQGGLREGALAAGAALVLSGWSDSEIEGPVVDSRGLMD